MQVAPPEKPHHPSPRRGPACAQHGGGACITCHSARWRGDRVTSCTYVMHNLPGWPGKRLDWTGYARVRGVDPRPATRGSAATAATAREARFACGPGNALTQVEGDVPRDLTVRIDLRGGEETPAVGDALDNAFDEHALTGLPEACDHLTDRTGPAARSNPRLSASRPLEENARRAAGIRRVGVERSALKCAAASRKLEFMRSAKYASRIGRPEAARDDDFAPRSLGRDQSSPQQDQPGHQPVRRNVSPTSHVSGSPEPRREILAQQRLPSRPGSRRQRRRREARQGVVVGLRPRDESIPQRGPVEGLASQARTLSQARAQRRDARLASERGPSTSQGIVERARSASLNRSHVKDDSAPDLPRHDLGACAPPRRSSQPETS